MSSAVEKKILSDFGIDPGEYMNDVVLSTKYADFDISPRINYACGGSIREGSLVLVSGKQKLGKSTLALRIAASAQNHADKIKRKVYYFDVENRIQTRNLNTESLHTDPDSFQLIGSTHGELLTAEKIFMLIEKLCRATTNSIFIVDSFGVLISKSEMEYDFEKGNRSNVPGMTSIFVKKMAQMLRPNRNTLIGILHRHANTDASGPYAAKTLEGGGTKIQYQSDYKFSLTHTEDIIKDEILTGHKVNFRCDWHPKNSPAFDTYFYHTFGIGVDVIKEVADMSVQIGIVKKAGAWYKFQDISGKDVNIQGLENYVEYVKENPKFLSKIKAEINEISG